jgi:MerR family transcriptional regulator, copper efflux regulator
MSTTFTTSALCKAASTSRGQLRLYEREGLLEAPARTRSGYRIYTFDAVLRLRAIHQLKALGLSLAEIAALLSERDHGAIDETELQARAQRLVIELDARLAQLAVVRDYVAAVATGDMSAVDDPDCRFLAKFIAASPATVELVSA